jgi:drug/metabolite transporter (DMT)-like permease
MTENKTPRRVAAFDIRLVIALLIGVYGLVLTVLGIGFTSDDELAKSADVNINLWAGVAMLAAAAAFVLWTVLRPLRVPEQPPDET